MRRTACTVRPVTSRTPTTTLPGLLPKVAAVPIIRTCERGCPPGSRGHDAAISGDQRSPQPSPSYRTVRLAWGGSTCPCGRVAKQSFSGVASARRVSKRDQSSVQSRKPAIIKETCDYGEEPTVSVLTVFRCVAGAVLASAAVTFPAALAARAQAPTQQELSHTSPSGNYLAARQANVIRDAASAAAYYRAALKSDPKNADLLELAFYAELAGGDVEEAVKLADRLVVVDRNNRNAHLVLGVRALKQKQFPAARTQFAQSMRGPITDLTGTLLTAWTLAGTNDVRGAIETI